MQAISLVGTVIADKYELISIAGSGGMGTVFKAKQLDLERFVAVKILDPEQVADQEALKRFAREARSISGLSNEHIAGFYSYGVLKNSLPYIVMEWLDGWSLFLHLQEEKPFSSERAVAIALQIADGLSCAHEAGIIHRDLKPANVILMSEPEPDFVKIVDFGLARIEGSAATIADKLTRTGFLIGTPGYLSPEQCQGEKADQRSDVYALGCILYEMLCGEVPFIADTAIGVMHKHVNESVTPPSKKTNISVPEWLQNIVLKCLEKSPEKRYQTMDELQDDLLNNNQKQNTASAASAGLTQEERDLRRKVIIARVVAGVVLAGGIALFAVNQWYGSESGNLAKAEFLLKNSHDRRALLESLDIAERLARLGGKASAQKIEESVNRILKADSLKSLPSYLQLAQELLSRGDNEMAFDFAFNAIKTMRTDCCKTRLTGSRVPEEAVRVFDNAAGIIARSKHALSKEQLNFLLTLVQEQREGLEKLSSGSALNLCVESIKANGLPPSDEVLRCMFARDLVLAVRAPLPDLEKAVDQSAEAANKYQPSTTIRPAGDPCLISHFLDVALLVMPRSRPQALKYLSQAEDLMEKVDRARQAEANPLALASCLERLAVACAEAGEVPKALAYARQAVECRPVQDLEGIRCLNTLTRALVLSRAYAEAEQTGTKAYDFLKGQPASDLWPILRFQCATYLFESLVALNKDSAAVKLLSSEIKEQEAHLPDSLACLVQLYNAFFAYHFQHSQLRLAESDAKRFAVMQKYAKTGAEKMFVTLPFIKASVKLKNTKLTAEAIGAALSGLKDLPSSQLNEDWLADFSSALCVLKKSDESQLYKQTLDLVQESFKQLLSSASANPVALARVVNDLGSSGEEKIADELRSLAAEKLSPESMPVFLSRSMDFVVGEGQGGARYADPQHAIKVYLDLAHNMQGRGDRESASKYAFEALKIVQVLGTRQPELRAELLSSTEDASTVLLQSKQPLNREQQKIIQEVASIELDAVKKQSKDHILDLALQTEHADDVLPPELVEYLFAKDDILAEHGQAAALEQQVNKTVHSLARVPGSALRLSDHLSALAERVNQRHDSGAAHRYLNLSRKVLEEVPEEQAAQDKSKLARSWGTMSNAYCKLGDRQQALACARKYAALVSPQDAGAAQAQLLLVDRLMDTGNFAEAEPIAVSLNKLAKAHAQSNLTNLRLESCRRLFYIFKNTHKDALAAATVRAEIDSVKNPTASQALLLIRLNKDLASHCFAAGEAKGALSCLGQIRQLKPILRDEQRSEWGRTGLEAELLAMAVKLGDSRYASESTMELVNNREIEKAESLKLPAKWWSIALANCKKTGETHGYKDVLDCVQQGFRQQLAKPSPDLMVLAEVINVFDANGEEKLAGNMRVEALKKLPQSSRDAFLAGCKTKSVAEGSSGGEAGKAQGAPGDAGKKNDESAEQAGEKTAPEEPAEGESKN